MAGNDIHDIIAQQVLLTSAVVKLYDKLAPDEINTDIVYLRQGWRNDEIDEFSSYIARLKMEKASPTFKEAKAKIKEIRTIEPTNDEIKALFQAYKNMRIVGAPETKNILK
ncbi:hypothetical protein RE735_13635 [Bacillus aerius]|uniref:hypothetical protein n=1 Tax=Bacillus aerius TaxID=293388 RepID=UPI0028168DD0|nr:hypothetical protein [Bacillus aerius]WMT28162.1 hypothetical protein RE735_13635 [Bacillus aerius]